MSESKHETIAVALRMKQYKQAERAALSCLNSNPRDAQAWVFLGEALLRQEQGMSAGKVFERASLLDPQAAWVDKVQRALQQAQPGAVHYEVEKLLQVPAVTITAAVLTRNEERCLQRCLSSLTGAFNEIIVFDSNSTDGTLKIAGAFPEVKIVRNIGHDDDFSAKRNAALKHVSSDWVLWVDADEWLEEQDRTAMRDAAGLFHDAKFPTVLHVCQVNYKRDTVQYEYSMPRMFQVNRGLQYYGRVHEQVIIEGRSMFDSAMRRQSVRIRLHHDGYEADIVQQRGKLKRNLTLLKAMVQQEPDNPGWLLYYGRETLGSGDEEAAIRHLLEAEQQALRNPRFARQLDIYLLLIQIYFSRKQYEQAAEYCNKALQRHPDYSDAHYWLGQIRMRQAAAMLQQAEQALNESKSGYYSYRGTVSADRQILEWKADAALADLARLTGKQERAAEIYASILTKQPKLVGIKRKLEKLTKVRGTESL